MKRLCLNIFNTKQMRLKSYHSVCFIDPYDLRTCLHVKLIDSDHIGTQCLSTAWH